DDESFDHVFVCFVLEHLSEPLVALAELKRVLKPGGTITAIEGDHGSCFWHPEPPDSLKVWDCMIMAQQHLGHDPLIGRRVYPLLDKAGFHVQDVSPKWVYADSSTPELLDGVVNRIIVPMTQTAREQSLELGLVDQDSWERGIIDLENVAIDPEGTFFYTWFKGVATK
ncbi:MAG: methyltransferase domain-containing protein, partial [Chloroflexi bacterium]|nr:methyltransferase domain-containing protein [Chloroflexota bacterium]